MEGVVRMMAEIDILNGFAGKVISDCIDITVNAIKKADKNRKSKNQTMETRIYQVIIDTLNVFPYNKYKKDGKVYDAAKSILKELKKGNANYKESVRSGLDMLSSEITGSICEDFLVTLCHEICKDENDIIYKEIILLQEEQVIAQQKQTNKYVQEAFRESGQNQKEILKTVSGVKSLIEEANVGKGCKAENKSPIVNRADEYAKRWDKNVFLNDFNKRDKNAGVSIKLREIYLEKHLPHYKWKMDDEPLTDLKELLMDYIVDNDGKKMLLILGQPGIGKSTLITWIMANLIENKENILVYQFAADLGNINWQGNDILSEIFETLKLGYEELENRTLILDGFDEIYASSDRERILNQIYHKLKEINYLKRFSLIITCRENYVSKLNIVQCDYITLQAWDREQIQSFRSRYEDMSGSSIAENTVSNILANKEILGVPLILYMILALNISIEENASIVNVYDNIFSVDEGGIYDRCIKNLDYDVPHRIGEDKEWVHRVSQRVAFWIFENNSERAFILQSEYKKICDAVKNEMKEEAKNLDSDALIGNFFKSIKHCEGVEKDELHFIHRSIYEYFVAIYLFESIYKLKSKMKVAGKLGELLKKERLSQQILNFVKYKFDSITEYNLPNFVKEIFQMMLQDGMTCYAKERYKNVIEREMCIFANMLEVVYLWNVKLGHFDNKEVLYLRCNHLPGLNLIGTDLSGMDIRGADLREADLTGADLSETDLRGADLTGADLRGADLRGADLTGADLTGADLTGADLRKANLRETNLSRTRLSETKLRKAKLRKAKSGEAKLVIVDLRRADLREADLRGAKLNQADLKKVDLVNVIFSEEQIDILHPKYDLSEVLVYVSDTDELISYDEYCIRKWEKEN